MGAKKPEYLVELQIAVSCIAKECSIAELHSSHSAPGSWLARTRKQLHNWGPMKSHQVAL